MADDAAAVAAAELQALKDEFAKDPANKLDGPCTNPKCKCPVCTCGPGCTCMVSKEKNCDPCAEFKAKKVAGANADRLKAAQEFFTDKCKPQWPEVAGITATELMELLKAPEPPLLVDCRSVAERSVSILKDSVAKDMDSQSKETRPMVVYCGIGGRSGAYAAELLKANPSANVRNFELSLIEWCHKGGELVNPETKELTKKVHGWGEKFAAMYPVEGYEVVLEPPVG
eukprot:gnl/TRDRNA2_/TRDRNA2_62321_c0_seq2.p2 gnl/TRDRNA2_/TRDRNA2_62321_c0~~gnl/TRDRNA2_/TRDRNA2_62321_c0_seq2.p2  ORF type:complete len:238 (+),score=69.17 gnl/TRDRNA2_/TRDRNA2_62321_c0_seq2:31-714(+)